MRYAYTWQLSKEKKKKSPLLRGMRLNRRVTIVYDYYRPPRAFSLICQWINMCRVRKLYNRVNVYIYILLVYNVAEYS